MSTARWAAFIVVLATTAFEGEPASPTPEDSVTDFGLQLFRSLPETDEANIVFSPLGVYALLAFIHFGARGTTASEIAKFSGGKPPIDIVEQLVTRLRLGSIPLHAFFTMANAIFVKKGTKITERYRKRVTRRLLRTTVKTAEQVSVGEVNRWAANVTSGLIPEFLEGPVSPSVLVMLLNAVYFKAKWEIPFKPSRTASRRFYNADGTTSKHDMMKLTSRFPHVYDEELDADVVGLPYRGPTFKFIIVVPRGRDGLEDVKEALDIEVFNHMLSNLDSRKVALTLPKFTLEAKYNLVPSLKSLGVKTAFGPKADLRELSPSRGLYASHIRHKAKIVVNETGSEAAAVTSVDMVGTSGVRDKKAPVRVIADRPFLFFIVGERKNAIIFMGQVNKFE